MTKKNFNVACTKCEWEVKMPANEEDIQDYELIGGGLGIEVKNHHLETRKTPVGIGRFINGHKPFIIAELCGDGTVEIGHLEVAEMDGEWGFKLNPKKNI